ncbi:MAG TPA: VapC toxin family PIN domain ribonuclease [Solibacterales bacterium]|nr:VapC toxin family PIN domain ribonuclease [Bryobacterales bacterium]
MILVDANILVYSTDRRSEHYERARNWLDCQLSGDTRVGLPWESLLAYMRLVTNPRVFERPQTPSAAWRQVEEWLSCECVWVPLPGAGHRSILAGLVAHLGGGSKLIPDAHLAAMAIEHGLAVCSSDGDFARFPGVRWVNPLAG